MNAVGSGGNSSSKPVTKAARLRVWGIFLVSSGFLFFLQEWVRLADWLWNFLLFGYVLLWYSRLWPSNPASPARKKSLLRSIGEFLIALALLVVITGVVIWLGLRLELRSNYAFGSALAIAGLTFLISSAGMFFYRRTLAENAPSNTASDELNDSFAERPTLINGLIDRIKHI